MSFRAIFLLALGLAMDATAVAAARGFQVRRIEVRHVLLVAGLFGGAQALMPALGWFLGSHVGPFIKTWDHWLAFVLLLGIGGKMLWESRTPLEQETASAEALFALPVMGGLAIATSMDALAMGITLPLLGAPLVTTLLTIGITTALASGLGLFVGKRFGAIVGKRFDALGGAVLIGLGVKILIEHGAL